MDQGRLVEKDLASENKQTWEDLKNFLDNKNPQDEESSLPPPESEPNNEVSNRLMRDIEHFIVGLTWDSWDSCNDIAESLYMRGKKSYE